MEKCPPQTWISLHPSVSFQTRRWLSKRNRAVTDKDLHELVLVAQSVLDRSGRKRRSSGKSSALPFVTGQSDWNSEHRAFHEVKSKTYRIESWEKRLVTD